MKRRAIQGWILLLAIAILVGAVIPGWETSAAESAGTVYYVDSADGDDGNAGTSAASAWKTLNRVNATTFLPGDSILFKAGGVWQGTLYPKGSGVDGRPVRIDKYGDGPKPLIAGNGADAAVYFYSQEYWEVRNLEITNYAATPGERRGVHVAGNSGGWNNPKVYRHFVFEHLDIHHVKGSLAMDYAHNGGIIVWDPSWNYVVTDVTIRNNKIYSLDSVGIYLNGGSRPYSFNNRVADNVIYDIGGDGAFMLNTTNGVIERNVVYDTHKRSSSYHVPLWVFESKDSVIQYNEVFNTYPGGDAMAYDADYKSDGTIIQYNYSHNNAGGMTLAVNDGTNASNYNRNTIIRYNISQNDLGAVFNFSGTPENTRIYNNTVYISPNSTTKVVDTLNWGGWAKDTMYTNNLIVNLGSGGYNFGSSTGNVFDNNLFYGNHPASVLAMDANKIVADPMLAAPGTGRIGRDTLAGYQLLEGSPAIGAGKPIANNGGFDFFGNPVPSDAAPNIGAYEGGGIPAGQLPPGAELVNLLANPGFEDGAFGGWTNPFNGAAIVDDGVRTGAYAARLSNAVSGIEQTVAVKPNTIYKLSGYAATAGGGSAVLGAKNFGNAAKDVAFGSADYSGREVVFTTGPASTSAVIYMYKQGGTGTVTFDDLLLYEYGEIEPPGVPPELAPEPLPGKRNLAPLAALAASSNNPAYPPALAADGSKDAASRWITNAGRAAPHWLELSWPQSYDIDRVRVWSGAGTGAIDWQIRDFQVQYWNGGEWVAAAEVTGNAEDGRIGEFNDLAFPTVHTDKIRLYITKGTESAQSSDLQARVFEVEVWEHEPNPEEPEVAPIYVIGVEARPHNRITRIDAGQTLAFQASVLPANADDRTVSWRVEGVDGLPTPLATIDANGVLTAAAPGVVRVVAEANDGSTVAGRATIEIATAPDRPNIAPLADVASSSDHENGSFPPELAINGVRYSGADRWISGPTGPHYLELSWDDSYEVDRVRLWSGQVDGRGMQLADFEIQAWDGTAWQTVASVIGNEEDHYEGKFNDLTFGPVVTDRIRLSVTKGNPVFDDRARVFELEAYGVPADEAPDPAGPWPTVVVDGPDRAYAGQPVELVVSVTESAYDYNTVNAIVAYDPAALEFATAEQDGMLVLAEGAIAPGIAGVSILGTAVKPAEGLINVLLGAPSGPIRSGGALFALQGTAKELPAIGASTVSLTKFEMTGPDASLLSVPVEEALHTIEIGMADRTALGGAIDSARRLHDAAVEGSGAGQYPTGSKATLAAAVQAAAAVYNDPTADQQAVNEARSPR